MTNYTINVTTLDSGELQAIIYLPKTSSTQTEFSFATLKTLFQVNWNQTDQFDFWRQLIRLKYLRQSSFDKLPQHIKKDISALTKSLYKKCLNQKTSYFKKKLHKYHSTLKSYLINHFTHEEKLHARLSLLIEKVNLSVNIDTLIKIQVPLTGVIFDGLESRYKTIDHGVLVSEASLPYVELIQADKVKYILQGLVRLM